MATRSVAMTVADEVSMAFTVVAPVVVTTTMELLLPPVPPVPPMPPARIPMPLVPPALPMTDVPPPPPPPLMWLVAAVMKN